MKRPKKNKISNPTLPEDQQTDERHLIDTEDSADVSFEDRIHMYWMENKVFISGCIAVLALAIIGFNGMRIYAAYAADKLQAAYAEAKADGTLEDFVQSNSSRGLGGLAAMEIADEAYADGDFSRAIEFYGVAVNALQNDVLLGRARVGEAFATYYNGDAEKALAQLRALAADSAMPDAIRAEAAYHLAINADVSGDAEAFERYASQVNTSATAGQWQQRMEFYQQQR